MFRFAANFFCAVFVAALCLFSCLSAGAGEKARIVRLMGKAEILKAGEWQPAGVGQELDRGEQVRVVGFGEVTLGSADGKVRVTGKSDTTIAYDGEVDAKVNPWKSARLAESGQPTPVVSGNAIRQFYSPHGEVSVQVTPGETLHLVTPLITASVRGTDFSMRADGDSTSSVGVCGGKVISYSRAGMVQYVCPGQNAKTTPKEYTRHLSKMGLCIPEGADWRDYEPGLFEEIDRRVLGQWFPNDY